MKKVYLLIENYSIGDNFDIQNIYVYKNYEDAKFNFENIRLEIKKQNYGFDEIEDEKDYYCESINGEYIYNHYLVYIKEKEVIEIE